MIEVIDLKQEKQEKCRVMLCQLNYGDFSWSSKHGLYYVNYDNKIKDKVLEFLKLAKHNSCDLVLFPELSIPEKLIEKIQEWSREQEAIVICGSHYYENKHGRISRCPIIIKGSVYFTEKVTPSPLEKSPISGDGIIKGKKINKFINSFIGDFAVLICSDYLDENIKGKLDISTLDLLCVPSFQRDSEQYYRRMNTDCENSVAGVYLLYSNFRQQQFGDGRSAVFGIMDKLFTQKLNEKGYTDLVPDKKLLEFNSETEYAIFDLDINNKRPYVNRNIDTDPNFLFIATNTQTRNVDLSFIQKIAHDDERYIRIDELFVPPIEYEEIIESLETKRIVFIVGDPGIGKTYTAAKILKNYFLKGFEPIWFAGLEKEEREVQSKILSSYIPSDNQVVYFEDPFGRTVFEKRDSLFQVFSPLLDKLASLNSRIIVTSRKEVFDKFSQESLLEKDVLDLKKELYISKPSYDARSLKNIFDNLASIFCDWFDQPQFRELVYQAIDKNHLTSPLSIRDLVVSAKDVKEVPHLEKLISRRELEVVKSFALEIRETSLSVKSILYLIFFCGNKGKAFLSELFSDLSKELAKIEISLHKTSFNVEVRTQLGFRVEQIGFVKTAYKFTHPVYEEALASLIISDEQCQTLGKLIVQEICEKDIKIGYAIINRIVIKYPALSLMMFNHILEADYKIEDDSMKLLLSSKLISTYHSTKNIEFFDLACKFFSLPEIVGNLNRGENSWSDLLPKLNLVGRYINNSPLEFNSSYAQRIEWQIVFAQKFKHFINPTRFIHLLGTCLSIDPTSVGQLINRVGVNMIKRTYFLLDETDRKKLFKHLRGFPIQRELKKYRLILNENEQSHNRNRSSLLRKIIFSDYIFYGMVQVDVGAEKAIRKVWNNLLPVGIVKIDGTFPAGAVIAIQNVKNQIIAVGVSEYSADDLQKIKGHQSYRFQELIGFFHTSCAIKSSLLLRFHRWNRTEMLKWKASPQQH